MRAAFVLALVGLPAAVFATSSVPIGTFGIWQVSSAPPVLPAAGEPMEKGGYVASAQGQNLNWRLRTQGSKIFIEGFAGKPCEEIEEGDFGPTKPLIVDVVTATLVRQTQAVEACLKAKPAVAMQNIATLRRSSRALAKVLAIMNGVNK